MRVKAKITVKNSAFCRRRLSHTSFFYCEIDLTRTSGVALTDLFLACALIFTPMVRCSDYGRIQAIDLSHNHIQSIGYLTFTELPELTNLTLSSNDLSEDWTWLQFPLPLSYLWLNRVRSWECRVRAAPLVRVKVKSRLKPPYVRSLRRQHTTFLTVNLAFTRTSGAALRRGLVSSRSLLSHSLADVSHSHSPEPSSNLALS